MKSFAFAIGTLAAVVAAQGSSPLSACGQTCADNMMTADKAKELGCQQNDLKCLCANANFTYGLRDCSAALCGSEDARKVVEYGIAVCRGVGVAITTSGGGNAGSGASPSAAGPSATPAPVTSAAGNGNSGSESGSVSSLVAPQTSEGIVVTHSFTTTTLTGGERASARVSTSATIPTGEEDKLTTSLAETTLARGAAQVSTFTTVASGEDGKPTTIVGETTLAGLASAPSTPSSDAGATSETSSAALTTVTSDGSDVVRTLSTFHRPGEGSFTATDSFRSATASLFEATGTGVASSSTSIAGASIPQMTAAPVGVLAVAGLAFLML